METITQALIELEMAALDRWGKGDPDGFLELYAKDVVYFDPYQELRIDGIEALTAYYEKIRGQVRYDHFELLNPYVQESADIAVLTFNYISYIGDQASRWNCTEAFRREANGTWRIFQEHWSYTNVFKYHKS